MAIADEHDDHSAYARAATTAERAAVGALRPARFAAQRWRTASRTRAPRTTTRCSPAARCSARRSCSPGSGASTRPRAARSSASTSPSARSTRSSSGCPSPRSRRSRSRAASSTEAEQYAHRALLLQRLSGYHWAAGLFLPAAGMRARRARPVRRRPATRSPPGRRPADEMEQAQRRPLLPVGRRLRAASGGAGRAAARAAARTRWSAATRGPRARVELAQREGATADIASAAHDLLVEDRGARRRAHRRHRRAGGPSPRRRAGSARRRGRRGRHAAARDRRRPRRSAPHPSIARAQADLAVILLRRGDARGAFALLDEAVSCFRGSAMEPDGDARRAAERHRHQRDRARRADRARTRTSIILFTDVVDSTRLTEELGASALPRPRPAGRAGHHRRDRRPRWHRRHRHQPGRRVHRPVPDRRAGNRRGARLRRRRAGDRPAPPRRGAPGRAHRRRRPHLRRRR